jgi:hypothetical protein
MPGSESDGPDPGLTGPGITVAHGFVPVAHRASGCGPGICPAAVSPTIMMISVKP